MDGSGLYPADLEADSLTFRLTKPWMTALVVKIGERQRINLIPVPTSVARDMDRQFTKPSLLCIPQENVQTYVPRTQDNYSEIRLQSPFSPH